MNKPIPRLSESEKTNKLFKAYNGFSKAAKLLPYGATIEDQRAAMGVAQRAITALSQLCADAGRDAPPKPRRLAQQRLRPVLSLRRKIGGAA